MLAKHATRFAPASLVERATRVQHPALTAMLGDAPLHNPIGLAAGFDKNGEMLKFLGSVGFGFLELGSITALPCPGNAKPRIFRLRQDNCLINRMGLPNIGAEAFAKHMRRQKVRIPYGINIAKTPSLPGMKTLTGIDDFLFTYEQTTSLGQYVTLNLSCPNTRDGHTFEDPKLFAELILQVSSVRKSSRDKRLLLIKLSPVVAAATLHKLVDIALKHDVDGFVLTNTTPLRPALRSRAKKIAAIGAGGLSGKPLLEPSNRQLRTVYDIVGGKKILVGVGGIMSFEDLLSKISCGGSLFQIYTGFIYQGPFFIRDLNRQLAKFCEKLGVKNYRELVGSKQISS